MPGRLIAALALIGLVAACEPPLQPFFDQEPRVMVHSVLDPSADTQKVILEWTFANSSTPSFTAATVRMMAPDGRVAVLPLRQPGNAPAPTTPTQARFILVLSQTWGALARGGTYKLEITMPGRATISGTTTLPDTTPNNTVLVHTFPFYRDVDTLRLKWGRVRGAAGYRVMSSTRVAPGNVDFPRIVGFFTDTAATLPGTKEDFDGAPMFPASSLVDITALAVDDNYFTYYKTAADPFAGAPPSRLTGGAVGLFGSVVAVHRRELDVR